MTVCRECRNCETFCERARDLARASTRAPSYTKTANLARESRDEFRRINLHFHDLRREAGKNDLCGFCVFCVDRLSLWCCRPFYLSKNVTLPTAFPSIVT